MKRGGGLWVVLARFAFLFGSYGLYVLLARIEERTGDRRLFADFKAVTAWVSVAATVVRQGATQMVARFVAAEPELAAATRRTALRLLSVVGLCVAFATMGLGLLVDERLRMSMLVAAWIGPAYALAAVAHGSLNGERRFQAQGLLDIAFIAAKLSLVTLGALIFGSALAAVTGFLVAAVLQAAVGAWLVFGLRAARTEPRASAGERSATALLRALAAMVAFALALQATVQLDLWWLRLFGDFADEAARDAGLKAYAGFQLFSQVPYALVAAVVFLVFPRIARAEADSSEGKLVLEGAVQATLLVAGLVLGGVHLSGTASLTLLFPRDAAQLLAADSSWLVAFRLLGASYLALCLLFVVGSALNARGRAQQAALPAAAAAIAQAGLALWLAPRLGLVGVALATLCAHLLGFALVFRAARREFGLVWPWATLGRVAVAVGALIAIGQLWPDPKAFATVLRSLLALAVYGLVMFALREPALHQVLGAIRERLARRAGA